MLQNHLLDFLLLLQLPHHWSATMRQRNLLQLLRELTHCLLRLDFVDRERMSEAPDDFGLGPDAAQALRALQLSLLQGLEALTRLIESGGKDRVGDFFQLLHLLLELLRLLLLGLESRLEGGSSQKRDRHGVGRRVDEGLGPVVVGERRRTREWQRRTVVRIVVSQSLDQLPLAELGREWIVNNRREGIALF